MSKITKKKKKGAEQNTAQKKNETKTSTIRVKVNMVTPEVKMQNNKENRVKAKPKTKIKKHKKKKTPVKPKKTEETNKTSKVMKFIGVLLLVISAGVFLFTTPLFNVTVIEVIGNEIVSSEEISSLSQIKLNENMFKNITSTIKQNIKGNAYIEDVQVKRVLPNKMQLIVQERKTKFMIKLLDSYAYINSQGYILEITDQTKEVPIIEGITTPEQEIILGKRLNNEDLKRLEVCLKIVSTCEENEISRYITSIKITELNEYIIHMVEKGKDVYLGNSSNLGTKILYVKAILQAEEGNEGEIFVNGDLNNGFQPYFRRKI